MDNVSIASYSFHGLLSQNRIDVFSYLESVRFRYHVGWADIWNGFFKGNYDVAYLKAIRHAMDERNLQLASLCCDWAHPWDDDPEVRKQNNETALNCLLAAEILGAKTVRFDIGVRERDVSPQQWDVVTERFTAYAKRGENAGFKVGPENHWGASRRLSVQRELFQRVNSPAYGMLLHLGNWDLDEGETADNNNLLAAPMAVHTHVNYEHAHRAETYLPLMREAGYQGLWGLEHHSGEDEYKKVARQLAEIRLANV